MGKHVPTLSRREFTGAAGLTLGLGGAAGTGSVRAVEPPTQLVVGHDLVPDRLNPFQSNAEVLFDLVFDRGVKYHPVEDRFVPWLFSGYSFDEDTDGGVTLDALLREGLTWSDGEPLNAEDIAFTVNYLKQHSGVVFGNTDFSAVESVRGLDERHLRYELSAPQGNWISAILGSYVLPHHVWAGVSDPRGSPPTELVSMTGTGPYRFVERDGSTLRFELREGGHVPSRSPEWFQADEPWAPALEVREVGGAPEKLVDVVESGGAHLLSHSKRQWTPDLVERVESGDDLDLVSDYDGSVRRVSFNVTRPPFDDVAFRRFLLRTWNDRPHLERRGANADRGDLVVPPGVSSLRPFGHEDAESRRFSFLGESGSVDIEAARDYLRNHEEVFEDPGGGYAVPDGNVSHEYSFGPARSGGSDAPDDRELYVDGEPLGTMERGGSDGPLTLVFVDQYADIVRDSLTTWAQTLRRVGVPVQLQSVAFSDLIERIFRRGDFDMFDIQLLSTGPREGTLTTQFGAEGIDENGFSLNAMRYTGAQDAIDRAHRTMAPEQHNRHLRDVVRQIFYDAPVMVYEFPRLLDPVPASWTGVTTSRTGVVNDFTVTNARHESATATPTPTTTRATTRSTTAGGDAIEEANEGGFAALPVDNPLLLAAGGVGALLSITLAAKASNLVPTGGSSAGSGGGGSDSGGSGSGGSDADGGAGDGGGDSDSDGAASDSRDARRVRDLDGVFPGNARSLRRAGFVTAADVASADREELTAVDGVSDDTADRMLADVAVTGDDAAGGERSRRSDSRPSRGAETAASAAATDSGGADESSAERDGTASTPFAEVSAVASAQRLRTDGDVEVYSGSLREDPTETVRIRIPSEDVDPERHDRFTHAAVQWNNVASHENVLAVRAVGEEPRPWVATEVVRGGTFAEVRADLPLEERVRLVGAVCDALRHASLYNTRHLALSPDRVHVTDAVAGERTVKVGSWGLGTFLDDVASPTPYTSPEQLDTEEFGPVGKHTDLYQLGALTYYVLSGRPPYEPDAAALGADIAAGDYTPLSEVDADLAPFEDVVGRALATDSELRYDSAHHLRLDLLGAL